MGSLSKEELIYLKIINFAVIIKVAFKYKSALFVLIILLLAYWNGLYTYYVFTIPLPIFMLMCNKVKI